LADVAKGRFCNKAEDIWRGNMNPQNIMALMAAWGAFQKNHPKFPAFLTALKNQGIKENSVIEISITDPEGKKIETNIKVQQSDFELFENLKNMRG